MNAEIGEKCAVWGVHGHGMDAARLSFFGLYALQHRGQASSGIVTSDGNNFTVQKGMGLVGQIYSQESIEAQQGYIAVGHNRYPTHMKSTMEHAQPVTLELSNTAHNGNLPLTDKLEEFLTSHNIAIKDTNDSEMMAKAIDYFLGKGASLEEAIIDAYPLFTGAFSLVVMTKDKLAAVRDSFGIRPLSMGLLNGGTIFSSETCALDLVGASHEGDVAPGEMVAIDKDGIAHRHQIVEGKQQLDLFEFVYFARPDSILQGQEVNEARRRAGKRLAQEHPVNADLVIPVPDSAIPAALGFAQESRISFDQGLVKNRYIGRTFIDPDPHQRKQNVTLKLNPLPRSLRGKRVVIVDDSIVRLTTAGPLVQLLKNAGAVEVHVRIASSEVKYPDFYGIDTATQNTLAAFRMSVKEMRDHIGATSLGFLSLSGLIEATGVPEENFCTSCFTGIYPIDIGERRNEIIFDRSQR